MTGFAHTPDEDVLYAVSPEMADRLERDYTYHAPHGDQTERYEILRARAHELALTIVERTPPGREQSLALTHLEEAVMYANAAIARNE